MPLSLPGSPAPSSSVIAEPFASSSMYVVIVFRCFAQHVAQRVLVLEPVGEVAQAIEHVALRAREAEDQAALPAAWPMYASTNRLCRPFNLVTLY
jgi:hypothetical protein